MTANWFNASPQFLIGIVHFTEMYCSVDDLSTGLESYCKKRLLPEWKGRAERFPQGRMSLSEVMTISILFHLSGYRCFKRYYQRQVCIYMRGYFPRTVSYNRFVELTRAAAAPLFRYTRLLRRGSVTGIGFIDSTTLKVCHNKRINGHKVFKPYAARGKNSVGWFYGFKLQLVINDKGEICSFRLSAGNVDDGNLDVMDILCRDIWGKLFGDKGYISQALFERLHAQGIQLITRIRKNMKNVLMNTEDKLLLRKRALIEVSQ